MDIPRGHAMLPLNESDVLDFIFNYYKAEYAPIRSIWATATAEPRQPQRWVSMGHELAPLTFRPANAQAQKDLEALDYFIRVKNLDANFVRGLVIRFAKYEVHERLEKKLYECARLDLMVRKALKEKHLIDALWPSPAPRDLKPELLQQGVRVRQWYGDMFSKYFHHLHSLDDFKLRPDVDARIRSSGTLMLVPHVEHLVFGNVDPIFPIVAKGAGYANSAAWKQKSRDASFGQPEKLEIRFDTPGDVEETVTKTVAKQCRCLKCGTNRDVTVAISIDPSALPISAKRARYTVPSQETPPTARNLESQPQPPTSPPPRPSSPQQKKACPRCTFFNHPDLTTCEICQADLPDTLVTSPPSPDTRTTSAPSSSQAAPARPSTSEGPRQMKETRPPANRHSLSSTLFSIFPFSHQHQSEHHANLPPSQPPPSASEVSSEEAIAKKTKPASISPPPDRKRDNKASTLSPSAPHHPAAYALTTTDTTSPTTHDNSRPSTPSTPLFQEPELPAMMTLSPASPLSPAVRPPSGLPLSLTDYDFVPVSTPSPVFVADEEREEAGWGEMSREEAKRAEDEETEEGEEEGSARGFVDLDEVAREEMGVWGKEDDG
ncbi:hypothetical protein M011DRAFT_400135 [Sporormia fimetaria CBS 119925]|uniref:RanBP2-type domain-containing protein n=1 Tax=Sporormia fimetaria CBS 119925 TaxID=1340428 RepID=A0A6A6VGX7_9PLEO|nr:hypothetical protein M011DRAFT_400135 [Sporormia fimetaria CBS 119925]